MSIIELMVGVAIGLVIVAAASLLMTGQLVENRRLLIETQLQQDLRATADIISRELRRAGGQTDVTALTSVWYEGTPLVKSNSFLEPAGLTFVTTDPGEVSFSYNSGGANSGPFGFKLVGGSIKTNLGSRPASVSAGTPASPTNWQELTDPNVMTVESFRLTPSTSGTAVKLPCPKLCTDGTNNCWPSYAVRDVLIEITAKAKNYAEVKRSISSRVRLRHEQVLFADATTNQMCPQ